MCDTYMLKKFKNSVLIEEISWLPLLNCALDFVVMFSMRFVHISHDDKLLKARARHIHTIQGVSKKW